jgi:hypothetical protein
LHHAAVNDLQVSKAGQQTRDKKLAIGDASTNAITCERIIVEAVIIKLADEDSGTFIDYTSL